MTMKELLPKRRSKRKRKSDVKRWRGLLAPFWRMTAESAATLVRSTPAGILLLAAAVFYWQSALPAALLQALPVLSYLILGFGLALTAGFGRGRAFFVLLTLLLSQWSLADFLPAHLEPAFVRNSLYSGLSWLLPLNILFYTLAAEHSVVSPWGRRCLLATLGQAAILTGMVWTGDSAVFLEFQQRFLPWSSLPTTLSDLALTAFVAAALGAVTLRRPTPLHFRLSMLGVTAAVAAAHHLYPLPLALPLFYAAAALMLLLAVVQDYYFKAYLDELTGLPSRRSLNEAMAQMEGDYVVAMLDVDFFKRFNDTYGHEAGDDVLRLIAGVMKTFNAGRPFRYGGEEFTFLLPATSLEEALPKLDALREKIAKHKLLLRTGKRGGKRTLSVTVSIGAAASSPRRGCCDDVIRAADAALYRAKENGRNCVSR
ncbi:MAG: GGDEF domain-containing protein [Sporomusaceae bacterium]|nr:GGDEF domain-containing protein [Sporomusaceae bacterium]